MWIDPIVEETRALRASVAAAHGNDLLALGRYFMAQQKLGMASAAPFLPTVRPVVRVKAPRRIVAA